MKTRDEFKSALVAFGERVQRFRGLLKNEEATKLSLIQPFISLLGYDPLDPTEVSAEHSADFSEKYRNKVDYVILKSDMPVIAVECKSVGVTRKDDRGQLKAYFNAVKTIKLGILTDGAVFELFVDSNEPNMMDDAPFLTVDFDKVVKGDLADTEVEGLLSITKQHFDPDAVGESARRSITYRMLFNYLADQFASPSAEFTRFLLKEVDIKNVRTASLDSYREIARSAFRDVFNASVLRKLDIPATVPPIPAKAPLDGDADGADRAGAVGDKSVVTTDAELAAFGAIKMRLAFLVSGNQDLFDRLVKVRFKDYQGKMVVYYSMERKGRLVDILEGRDGIVRYALADGGDTTPTSDLQSFEERLKAVYLLRVAELG